MEKESKGMCAPPLGRDQIEGRRQQGRWGRKDGGRGPAVYLSVTSSTHSPHFQAENRGQEPGHLDPNPLQEGGEVEEGVREPRHLGLRAFLRLTRRERQAASSAVGLCVVVQPVGLCKSHSVFVM